MTLGYCKFYIILAINQRDVYWVTSDKDHFLFWSTKRQKYNKF